jgi:guanine deaminase
MDANSPEDYIESAEESLKGSLELIDYIRNEVRSELILPIITPRFAPSCTKKSLINLGNLAAKENCHV